MLDPEPYLARLLEDEGLTNDLNEADALALVQGLSTIVEHGIPDQTTTTVHPWIASLARRARLVAKVVAAYRERGPLAGKQLAQQFGLAWPKDEQTLIANLLGVVDR